MKSDIRHVNTVLNVNVRHFTICIRVYLANVSSACTSSMSTTDCIAGYTVVLLDIIDPTVSLCHALIKNDNNHLKKQVILVLNIKGITFKIIILYVPMFYCFSSGKMLQM